MTITTADCKKYLNKDIAKCKDWKRVSKKKENGIDIRVFTGTKGNTHYTATVRADADRIMDVACKEKDLKPVKDEVSLKEKIQKGPVWQEILKTEKENGLFLGDDFNMDDSITLVDLQEGETIETVKDAIKNGTLEDLCIDERDLYASPEQVLLNYIRDQQYEVENPDGYSNCIIFPDGTIKKYNFKIINYDAGEYSVWEVK